MLRLVMPEAVGLFRRAILQSLPGTFFTPDLAADVEQVPVQEPVDLELVDEDALLGRHADPVGVTVERDPDVGAPARDLLEPRVDEALRIGADARVPSMVLQRAPPTVQMGPARVTLPPGTWRRTTGAVEQGTVHGGHAGHHDGSGVVEPVRDPNES